MSNELIRHALELGLESATDLLSDSPRSQVMQISARVEAIRAAINSLAATASPAAPSGELPPEEHDEDMDRHYLPLPNGWEIQTKGKGSTFRICKVNGEDDYERWAVTDESLHDPLQRIAEDCRAAIAHQPPKEALTDERIALLADETGFMAKEDVMAEFGFLCLNFARAIESATAPNKQLVAALQGALAVIDDYLGYEHNGDPWVEDARAMGEMDIDDCNRDGRIETWRAALASAGVPLKGE